MPFLVEQYIVDIVYSVVTRTVLEAKLTFGSIGQQVLK
jgi:hypothetical protein